MIRLHGIPWVALAAGLLVGCGPDPADVAVSGSGVAEEVAVVEQGVRLPEVVSFNEHIQPILSEYCYHCHGPDAGTRRPDEAPLRLDIKEDAFEVREDGRPVIIVGDPEESALVKRMRSHDKDLIMPPPESHKVMEDHEIALIAKWIEQGAEYEEHWSFTPVERPEVPEAGDGWAVNPIDRFVASRLDEHGLKPNPLDEPRRFFRRIAFDLTGMPPEPEQVDAFLDAYAADGEAAVVAAADRLMASDAGAEHFARLWLDVARYADTHGIHIDNYRAIWPYRDWVIGAFKQNMPWDQFTTEQMAGDLLPDRSLDQLVASGFNRCMATTGEGGAIAEEYEAVYAKDQADTVSAVWLGLTTGCAACHDHKFDPISTKDFYSLTAFFRNTTMGAMDKNAAEHPPSLFVPARGDREQWASLEVALKEQKAKLDGRAVAVTPDFEKWLTDARFQPLVDMDVALELHLPMFEAEGPLRGMVNGEPREWPVTLKRTDGLFGKASLFDGVDFELGDIANFSRDSQVIFSTWIRIEGKPSGAVMTRMDPDQQFRGWGFSLEEGRPVFQVIDRWEDAESRSKGSKALEPGKWHHLLVIFDGHKSGHQAVRMHLNGKQWDSKTYPNTAGGLLENDVPLRVGVREDGKETLGGGEVALQDLRIYRRFMTFAERKDLAQTRQILEDIDTEPDQRSEEQVKRLKSYYMENIDRESIALRQVHQRLMGEEAELRKRGSMSLIMEEKDGPAFAHVLNRGVYTDKGEKVFADTLSALPAMADDAPKNRLGLAMWLNDPANPLPARVTMNRAWSYLFGKGIVETNGDFGIMGARPSHPKLLDWLAAEFVASGWNYRHMVKLMVTSAAYRQSGVVTQEKLEKDSDNALLSRGPRHRLDGEQIRDLALSASGLLSEQVGGPPVRPYQPEGIWNAVAMPQSNTRYYKQDFGDKLYRRSIYTIWKRTAPPPAMEIFNAPTREVFCVQRERTNTPLQALVLLNDPQFVEACRALAARSMQEASGFDQRLDIISVRLLSRVFDDAEREVVRGTLDAALADFKVDPDEAYQFVTTGDSPLPEGVDVPELAAWTLVASQVLNLDETVTR